MRPLTLTLIALIIAIQYPLWFGKGSWLRVWHLDQQLDEQRANNETRVLRNSALNAEVLDLKTGLDAIEERARTELGMIKSDEVFFQVLKPEPGASEADQ
ncbi:MAG: cell division protein FtsB [Betaproteobacteria bacterium]|nr:MAG: cell division protein FtsB [Betaproteobacteria bacterium]